MFAFSANRDPARASEPAASSAPSAASFEETYAGWTQEQLGAALEARKRDALALKNEFDERIEPTNRPSPELDQLVDEIEWLTAATRASSDP
jgi:hypothetical protein